MLSSPYIDFFLVQQLLALDQAVTSHFLTFFLTHYPLTKINPLPHVPILGCSTSAANKDITSKIWTNGDTII